MAELSKEVLKKDVKLVSITDFKKFYAEGVSSQAIDYAIKNDKIDYLKVGDRVRVIVLTSKSLTYKPNKSDKRISSVLELKK